MFPPLSTISQVHGAEHQKGVENPPPTAWVNILESDRHEHGKYLFEGTVKHMLESDWSNGIQVWEPGWVTDYSGITHNFSCCKVVII